MHHFRTGKLQAPPQQEATETLVNRLAVASEVRGTDASGIAGSPRNWGISAEELEKEFQKAVDAMNGLRKFHSARRGEMIYPRRKNKTVGAGEANRLR